MPAYCSKPTPPSIHFTAIYPSVVLSHTIQKSVLPKVFHHGITFTPHSRMPYTKNSSEKPRLPMPNSLVAKNSAVP